MRRRPWNRCHQYQRHRRRRSFTTSFCPTGSAWRPRPPAFSRRSKRTWPEPCSSRSYGLGDSSGPGSSRRECFRQALLFPLPRGYLGSSYARGSAAPGVKAPKSGAREPRVLEAGVLGSFRSRGAAPRPVGLLSSLAEGKRAS